MARTREEKINFPVTSVVKRFPTPCLSPVKADKVMMMPVETLDNAGREEKEEEKAVAH